MFSTTGISQSNQPEQPAIRGVIDAGVQAQLVKDGFSRLEGPVATPDGGLYFSDIDENRTYKLDRDGRISVWRENMRGTNGQYVLPDGRLLCAEGGGKRIVSVAPAGSLMVLADAYGGKPLRQPNDLIPDRRGGVYFTDPAPRPAPDVAPKEPGNVHYIRPGGEVILIDGEIARPNGLTLSLDEKTLYVDDTEGEYVYAFEVQVDGSTKNKRRFVGLHDPEPGSFGPRSRADGMALDSEGRIYVGTASGVQVIDPKGNYLGTIRIPAVARNLAFGGVARRTLYLTTMKALYQIRLLSHGPDGRAK